VPESYVQVPANSTGVKLRSRQRTVGANTVDEQFFTAAPDVTFYAYSGSAACAANKHFLSILNTGAQVFHVEALYLINTALVALTGVALQFDIKKVTAVSGGTAITVQQADSTDTAIASTTIQTAPPTVTEGAVLWSHFTNNDEVGVTNGFPTSNLQAWTNMIPDIPNVKKPTLNVNEGITVKQITSSTVGSFAVLAVITKAP
jgi:hypothetical protein